MHIITAFYGDVDCSNPGAFFVTSEASCGKMVDISYCEKQTTCDISNFTQFDPSMCGTGFSDSLFVHHDCCE